MAESKAKFPNLEDGLGDWRIRAATRLAQDVPARYPSGPSHKAGAAIYLSTGAQLPSGANLSFITPDATALALSIAIKAARHAERLRSSLEFKDVVTPNGPGKSLQPGTSGELFDFFESCMVVVTFSFQALESFANSQVSELLGDRTFRWRVGKKSEPESLPARALERLASTEDKFGTILPDLLGIKSPRGSKRWEDFMGLKRLRDSTIHLKSKDQYPKGAAAANSLMFQLLGSDIVALPDNAVRLIRYFVTEDSKPRWLDGVGRAFENGS